MEAYSLGAQYRNVKTGCLSPLIYSKGSIGLLTVIAVVSAFNIFLLMAQMTDASRTCKLNDFLPVQSDYRGLAMPIVWYCRFLEFSIPTTFIQVLLCLIALFAGLNRRNNLFVCGYSFLSVAVLFSLIFLSTMFALQSFGSVQHAIRLLLLNVPYDESFCGFISSALLCRLPCRNSTDLIVDRCGEREVLVPDEDCYSWLTKFLHKTHWTIGITIEYVVIVVCAVIFSIRACTSAEKRAANDERDDGQNDSVAERRKLLTWRWFS